ncbi:amino acid kinase family protein [mine drainage metagenome]|uniref:Amino acid kinase family protein n=1 Tax=mine drainage metagenome TaxID=410659 RepID=A0A1J5PY13_9ZZZZ
MWVVKLGGSLLGQPELKTWLSLLARQSDGRVVIVPGGGVFADAVRSAQVSGGFDDATAHHMALLAMEQFGLLMRALRPELVTASSELEIAERSWQHRAIIWMPSSMVLADRKIPTNWTVTSDSLAAWLARKIGADRLVLVKHAGCSEQPLPIDHLVEQGLLDSAFAEFSAPLTCPIQMIAKTASGAFADALAGASRPVRAI